MGHRLSRDTEAGGWHWHLEQAHGHELHCWGKKTDVQPAVVRQFLCFPGSSSEGMVTHRVPLMQTAPVEVCAGLSRGFLPPSLSCPGA